MTNRQKKTQPWAQPKSSVEQVVYRYGNGYEDVRYETVVWQDVNGIASAIIHKDGVFQRGNRAS